MLPQNKKDQSGCVPSSSNCVIWQGPDIPCIDLCKGDSITDVTYRLATELCDLLALLNIDNFDISCFDLSCPKLETIEDLLQFILDKLCELKSCCETNANDIELQKKSTTEILYTIASCFRYIDGLGNNVITLSQTDYITAIGNKVCELKVAMDALSASLLNIDIRLTDLENIVAAIPPIPDYIIAASCINPLSKNIPIITFVTNLELKLCEYINVIGPVNVLSSSISGLIKCVDDTDLKLADGLQFNTVSRWVDDVDFSTVADFINNMWIIVCDLRTAVTNLQGCCEKTCDDLNFVLNQISSEVDGVGSLKFTLDGVFPPGSIPCNGLVQLSALGVTSEVSWLTAIGVAGINTGSMSPALPDAIGFLLTVSTCVKLADGTKCIKTLYSNVDNGLFPIPVLSWSPGPGSGEATYSFVAKATSPTYPVSYLIVVYENGTENVLATDYFTSSGGSINRTIEVTVPRPVTIEWKVIMMQDGYTVTGNKVGTFIIPI